MAAGGEGGGLSEQMAEAAVSCRAHHDPPGLVEVMLLCTGTRQRNNSRGQSTVLSVLASCLSQFMQQIQYHLGRLVDLVSAAAFGAFVVANHLATGR